MHRPLPRRPPDRLHDQPLDRFERRLPPPASRQGTAVIVGAGPAGAAAAACAHMRGMRVVVFEATDGPGGQMRLATAAVGARRDRRRPDRHRRPLAVGLRRAVLHNRDRRRRARRVARPRHRRDRRRALRRRAARRTCRRRVGRAGGRRRPGGASSSPTGAATGPAWPSRSCSPARGCIVRLATSAARVRRDDPPVPAQSVPGAARPGRRRAAATTSARSPSRATCWCAATCSRSARCGSRASTRWWPAPAARRTARCSRSSRTAAPNRCASATHSARDRSKKRSARAPRRGWRRSRRRPRPH